MKKVKVPSHADTLHGGGKYCIRNWIIQVKLSGKITAGKLYVSDSTEVFIILEKEETKIKGQL